MIAEDDKQKIDQSDIVSFDIFDTLLVRNTAHPTDVFRLTQELFNEKTTYFLTDDIHTYRVQAEKQARSVSDRIDVTIEDIYKELRSIGGYSEEIATEIMSCELQAEEMVLTGNNHVRSLYDYALKSDKKIAIVSDMYLPVSFLAKVLNKNGFSHWDKIIVSCEDNVGKYCGSAFAMLISEYPDEKILHIGDNEWSDIAWSSAFNIDNIHIHANIEEVSFERNPAYRIAFGGDRYRDSLDESKKSIGDIQSNLISGMAANYLARSNRTPAEAMGYSVLGPLLVGFSQWLDRTARSSGADHIYFLARDGAIMQRAYNAYYEAGAISSTYTFGSRRLLNFPAIFETIGLAELDTLTAADHSLDISKTLRYFGVDPQSSSIKRAFERVGLATDSIVRTGPDMERVKAAILLIQDQIFELSSKERAIILSYFNIIDLTGNSSKSILCDIGWHGSMQRSIGKLIGKDLRGAYFGVHDNEKTRVMGDSMLGYLDSRTEDGGAYTKVVDDGIEVIEFLFTNPDQASIVGISESANGFKSVEGGHDTTEEERLRLRSIQDAAIEFVAEFRRMGENLPKSMSTLDKAVAFKNLRSTIQSPSDAAAELLGASLHSFTAGSVPRYIGMPSHHQDLRVYNKNPKLLYQEYSDAFWKQGFKKNVERLGLSRFM